MGKASNSKKNRPRRRSRRELLELLDESRQMVHMSADAFDAGFDAEAKRLAVLLRVLLHDTKQSHSLLKQLGVKDRLDLLDTAEPIHPANLLPTPGLVIMQMTTTETGASGQYVAPLGNERPSGWRLKPFAGWWQNPVMKVDGTWSRRDLVLSLANQQGGAHVDPTVDERYERLAKENGLGWTAVAADRSEPFGGSPIAAAVRQIAFEVMETFDRQSELFEVE